MTEAPSSDLTPTGPGLPAVSVVVATRDRPEMLARAVRAILGQTYGGPIECIVVFDQSAPTPVAATARNDRIVRVLTNTRTPGLAGGRNTGILAATGSLVAFCDDDDEWVDVKLARQVVALDGRPATAVIGCGVVVVEDGREVTKTTGQSEVSFVDLLRKRVWELHPSTLLARLEVVRGQIGLIDEELPGSYGEDYDWLLRASKLGAIPMIDEPLVRITWHQGSFFQQRWAMVIDALTYLLDKHPEFATEPSGLARIQGQVAFAHAANGNGRAARRMAMRCLRNDWRERRGYLAVAVSWHLITPTFVLRAAHSRGKGI